jgi:hypothetical protein
MVSSPVKGSHGRVGVLHVHFQGSYLPIRFGCKHRSRLATNANVLGLPPFLSPDIPDLAEGPLSCS